MNSMQCKLARTALALGVRDLAVRADVSPNTIARLERGEEMKQSTIDKIRAVLEAQGVQFLEDGQVATGLGVALKGKSR